MHHTDGHLLALGWVAVGAADASAAWNNVFQATCGGGELLGLFAPPPTPCCPSVSYVQRCYSAVTVYKTETYFEPITTYRTSYCWEPVTTYRYTSYYDPCTGCCQQVAVPCRSYSLRARCNAVRVTCSAADGPMHGVAEVVLPRAGGYAVRIRARILVRRHAGSQSGDPTDSACPNRRVRHHVRVPGSTSPRSRRNGRIPPTESSPRKVGPVPVKPLRPDRVASRP